MTIEQMIGLAVALLIMILGILGSILPGIPSTPLVLLGAVFHRIYFADASISNLVLILLLAMTLFSLGLDYIASMVGAKKLGATWRGVLGAVIGTIIGLFFSLPGLILGPFLGAVLFEMMGGREFDHAARAGVGALLGLLAGAVGKMACGIAMTGIFAVNVLARSISSPETEKVLAKLVSGLGIG